MKFEVVVRNLNNYKEARVELPGSRYVEKLSKELGEDWMEHDYDIVDLEDEYNIFSAFRLYGFESLERLNKLATEIENQCSDNHSLKTLQASSEVYMDIDEVLELMKNNALILHENHEPEDIAEWYVDEGFFGDVSDKLLMYIDFEKLGRDIMLDGNLYDTKHGILEEIR